MFFIVGGGIAYFVYKGSGIESDINYYKTEKAAEAEENLDTYYYDQQESIEGNKLLSNAPLLFFWGAIGVIVFYTVSSLVRAVGEVDEFVHELNYVNTTRRQKFQEAALHLAIRLGAALALLVVLKLFTRMILPYTLALARLVADNTTHLINLLYVPLVISIIFIFGHVLAVLARFIVLRTRVFG